MYRLKTTDIYYLLVPVSWKLASSFTGWLWLRVSHVILMKTLAKAIVIWKIDSGWTIHFQHGSFTRLLAEFLPWHLDLSKGLFECFYDMAAGLPQRKTSRESKMEAAVTFMPYSWKSHTNTSAYLTCWKSVTKSISHSKRNIKTLWTHFKSVTVYGKYNLMLYVCSFTLLLFCHMTNKWSDT